MSNLTFEKLENKFDDGFTILDNIFIHRFMPHIKSDYIKVYLDGLMRCFGDKTSHFTSVKTIAKDLMLSERTVQRAYKFFENISIYSPNHEYSDREGKLYLVKRQPRFLKYSGSDIAKVSNQINALKNKKNQGSLTEEEEIAFEKLQNELNLMLTDEQSYMDDEYKYQTSNTIIFLTNLKSLSQEDKSKFVDAIKEENLIFNNKLKSKTKDKNKDNNSDSNKDDKNNQDISESIEITSKDKLDDIPLEVGDRSDTPSGDRSDTPPGDSSDVLISTNSLINKNSLINTINQSIDGQIDLDNNIKFNDLSDKASKPISNNELLDKQLTDKGFMSYKELIQSLYLGDPYYWNEEHKEWLDAISKAIWEIYNYPDTRIFGNSIPRLVVIEKLQQLNNYMIECTINKVIEKSHYEKIGNVVGFIKTTLFNEIDENVARLRANINYDSSNNNDSNGTSSSQSRTSEYTSDELEDIAKEKRDAKSSNFSHKDAEDLLKRLANL